MEHKKYRNGLLTINNIPLNHRLKSWGKSDVKSLKIQGEEIRKRKIATGENTNLQALVNP